MNTDDETVAAGDLTARHLGRWVEGTDCLGGRRSGRLDSIQINYDPRRRVVLDIAVRSPIDGAPGDSYWSTFACEGYFDRQAPIRVGAPVDDAR